jgi:hypothetical protein
MRQFLVKEDSPKKPLNQDQENTMDVEGWLEHSSFSRHESVKEYVGLSVDEAEVSATGAGVSEVRVMVLDRPAEEGIVHGGSNGRWSANGRRDPARSIPRKALKCPSDPPPTPIARSH